MVALDYSREQVRIAARTPGVQSDNPTFVQGDVASLPLANSSLDFAYSINVFHHLSGPAQQARAFAEVARVLRPGGVFFLHEMNVRNPLFRFYLNYVFPLLRGIDEGTENWLLPDRLPFPPELALTRVEYFTFLPDFLPLPLLRVLSSLEARLESGSLARFGAHYMAVFTKRPNSTSVG
jgi:SAM-dependent methyltransferase